MTDETAVPIPTEDWRVQAIQELNAKIPNAGNCLACGPDGVGKVIMADHLITPVITDIGGGISLGGVNYPQLMLICRNCGFTRYFNYLVLKGGGGGPDAVV